MGHRETRPAATTGARLATPHRHIEPRTTRERVLLELFDRLWEHYRDQVPAVGIYEQVVAKAGATFVNDHCAFRTIAGQEPMTGIASLSRPFEALGYQAAGAYVFPDKHLFSLHFEPPRAEFPKLFISELRSWEMEKPIRKVLTNRLKRQRQTVTDSLLADLAFLDRRGNPDTEKGVRKLLKHHERLPWPAPREKDVRAVAEASQFGAWVLLFGNRVNHFTALVNSHGVSELSDIEKTAGALRAAGVAMKADIEGAPGSKLRQTATEAAMVKVETHGGHMEWPYAYFELAERGEVTDATSGAPVRFEGFLGPQATQLFEMTKKR